MEPIARLFLCLLCGVHVKLCSTCDRGQLYCGKTCANIARQKGCRLANARYQKTPKGRQLHAARQARYRARLKKKVTDHSSLMTKPNVLIISLENKPKTHESNVIKVIRCCGFCGKNISAWLRNDFLKRRINKKPRFLTTFPQAP